MIQDRALKAASLRYVVAKRWLPQLELDVSTYITLSRTPTTITDVDVYAAVPDEFVGFRGVAIDCKTRKGESPISRAMWQRGLIERLGAERGICVLRVPRIEPDHRYTAAQFGVTLLADHEFDAFATATASDYRAPLGAIADIGCWDQYFAIAKKFTALESTIRFSRSGYWMSDDEAEACTRTIFLLSKIRPELDPDRPEHLAVVADILSLFLHSLARIVVKVFAAYLQPNERRDLSTALLHYLYGGRGAYDHLNRIRRMLAEARSAERASIAERANLLPLPALANAASDGPHTAVISSADDTGLDAPTDATIAGPMSRNSEGTERSARDLSLPEWNSFVELVRQMLDAPMDVARAPLLAREIAWSCFGASSGGTDGVSSFAKTLAVASPQAARFTVLALDYLCRAARLPREFNAILSSRLLLAQIRS